uniref:DUF202 domain-containing protein n=1 Tax=Mycena chlorophos TaxID=658473 RepID=A0ABQ0L6Q6_MYCCL|nr:predicted protein [Mycena chlorophos]
MSSLASTPSDGNNERTPLLPQRTSAASNTSTRPNLNTVRSWPSSYSHRSSNNADESEESLKDPDSEGRRAASVLHEVSLLLENRGTVARDHLASERTFLAYVRTSLAVAAAGVALMQLFRVNPDLPTGSKHPIPAKLVAAGTIILSLCILGIGVSRYFIVQASLVEGKYPAPRWTLGFVALAAGALMFCALSPAPSRLDLGGKAIMRRAQDGRASCWRTYLGQFPVVEVVSEWYEQSRGFTSSDTVRSLTSPRRHDSADTAQSAGSLRRPAIFQTRSFGRVAAAAGLLHLSESRYEVPRSSVCVLPLGVD